MSQITDRRTPARTGPAIAAGGVLLATSVAAELLHPVQAPDGEVLAPALFALYLGAWTAGAALLALGLLRSPGGPTRAARTGRGLALGGAVLLLLVGATVLGTALVAGRPLEASFLLFALGLLISAAGALALGLSRPVSPVLLIAGAGALVALLAPGDPWHDLGLIAFCLAWAWAGLRPAPRRPVG